MAETQQVSLESIDKEQIKTVGVKEGFILRRV